MQSITHIIDDLSPLFGVEQSLDQVNYALKSAVRSQRPAFVGAMHLTCSDEAEHEAAESFQRCFAQDMLPRLKHGQQGPFRSASLGGRYDWGSIRIAEANFAATPGKGEYKMMVVRVSSHCAAHRNHGDIKYGHFTRYGRASHACGALNGLLTGATMPFAQQLHEAFASEGNDRINYLRAQVPIELRMLYGAVSLARLQARSVAIDAQDHVPATPTVYVIVHSVNLHKHEKDTELVGGMYVIDRRGDKAHDYYHGIGDDPANYTMQERHGIVHVADGQPLETRTARNHRKLIPKASYKLPRDPRVEQILNRAGDPRTADVHATRAIAQTLLLLLAELTPVPAALTLFATGAAGVYNVYRAHEIVSNVRADSKSREILLNLHDRLDHMPPERARQIVEVLQAGYAPTKK